MKTASTGREMPDTARLCFVIFSPFTWQSFTHLLNPRFLPLELTGAHSSSEQLMMHEQC